jgi:poly(hydroxyalkanoate) granule-associated protein
MTAVIEVEQAEEKEPNLVIESARKVFLVGVGALALVQEEVSTLAEKLVERGEKMQKERVGQFNKMVEARRKESREATKKAEQEMEKRIEQILHRLNIPTSTDIQTLNTKITTLSRKVDELKKATTHAAAERVSHN